MAENPARTAATTNAVVLSCQMTFQGFAVGLDGGSSQLAFFQAVPYIMRGIEPMFQKRLSCWSFGNSTVRCHTTYASQTQLDLLQGPSDTTIGRHPKSALLLHRRVPTALPSDFMLSQQLETF